MIPADQKMPVLCFDGDNAGRRAAARACERILPLLKPDHSVRLAFLPDGQDPDSLIKARGEAAFGAVIDSAIPLVDFLWTEYTTGRRFDTPEEQAGLGKTLENEALKIADRDVQHYYRDAFRRKIREAFAPVYGKIGSWGKGAKAGQKFGQKFGQTFGQKIGQWGGGQAALGLQLRRPTFSRAQTRVQILLACILNHPELFTEIEDGLGCLPIEDPRFSALRQSILQVLGADSDLDSSALQAHLKGEGYQIELESVLCEAVYTHGGFARPNSELDIVQKGWQHILSQIQGDSVSGEVNARWKALADHPNEENERRLLAFQLSNRASQNQDD